MDDDYQRAQQENLRNPKNRFLFLFCHAKDVDNSWGYNWSFQSGVILFSILIGIASLMDIYYIAEKEPFNKYDGWFDFMLVLKILSDVASFIGIIAACYGVGVNHYTASIVAYYIEVLSFFLNTIYSVYSVYALFKHFKFIGPFFIPWILLEICLLVFCWILFANQVTVGRERRAKANQTY